MWDKRLAINFILFQCVWFACVVGAAKYTLLPAIISLAILVIWQSLPLNYQQGDAKLVLLALLVGVLLDSLWINLSLLSFALPNTIGAIAPLWILCLWVAFALTFNHSLAWLKGRYGLAAIMSLFFSPLSYLAAQRMGAVDIAQPQWQALLIIGIAWALLVPVFLYAARIWNRAAAI